MAHRDVLLVMVCMNGIMELCSVPPAWLYKVILNKVGQGALPEAKERVAVGRTVSREGS